MSTTHQHEAWQVREAPDGSTYCAACGETVTPATTAQRLEYLRGELRAERISQGELIELQGLAEFIEPGDVELLEAAGVPEFPEEDDE
jgi:hypothetical protein